MIPNPFFKTETSPSRSSTKMEHNDLYWGQHPLGQNVYPAQNLQGSESGTIPFTYNRSESSSSSSSTHLQALRDFMPSLYPQQLPSPSPLLMNPMDHDEFRPSLPEVGVARSPFFGGAAEKTPHRTQFQRESHILAERQRREEMNDKFASLRAMLPKSSKKDKASIVGDTITYLVELEKTLKQLQAKKAKSKCSKPEKEAASGPEKKPGDDSQIAPETSSAKLPTQVEVQSLGEQAVVKLVCSKSPKLVLKILTALEQCKVEVLQSNVTTLGETAVHFFTVELTPGLSASTENLVAAIEAAASFSPPVEHPLPS